jgi:hypothetical protein
VSVQNDRWQVDVTQDGQTSIWYTDKITWDGNDSYPILRLHWRMVNSLPNGKLTIPVRLSVIDPDGQATIEGTEVTIVMLGSTPKIDSVDPTSFSNVADTTLSIHGSDFMDTPKIYLQSWDSEQIELRDVNFAPDYPQAIWCIVPAGAKPGVYKIRLVNPDGGSTEYSEDIIILTNPPTNTPTATPTPTRTPTRTPTATPTHTPISSGQKWLYLPLLMRSP